MLPQPARPTPTINLTELRNRFNANPASKEWQPIFLTDLSREQLFELFATIPPTKQFEWLTFAWLYSGSGNSDIKKALFDKILKPPSIIDLNTPQLGATFLLAAKTYGLYHENLHLKQGSRHPRALLNEMADATAALPPIELLRKVLDDFNEHYTSGYLIFSLCVSEPITKTVYDSVVTTMNPIFRRWDYLSGADRVYSQGFCPEYHLLEAMNTEITKRRKIYEDEAKATLLELQVLSVTPTSPPETKRTTAAVTAPAAAAARLELDSDEKADQADLNHSTPEVLLATLVRALHTDALILHARTERTAMGTIAVPFSNTAALVEAIKNQACWHAFFAKDGEHHTFLQHLINQFEFATLDGQKALLAMITTCLEVAPQTQIRLLSSRLDKHRELRKLLDDKAKTLDAFDYYHICQNSPIPVIRRIGDCFLTHFQAGNIDKALHVVRASLTMKLKDSLYNSTASKFLEIVEQAGQTQAVKVGIELVDTGGVYSYIGGRMQSRLFCDYVKKFATTYMQGTEIVATQPALVAAASFAMPHSPSMQGAVPMTPLPPPREELPPDNGGLVRSRTTLRFAQ